MDELLKPDEEQLSTLAAQMGVRGPDAPAPDKRKRRPTDGSVQKSYSQLT